MNFANLFSSIHWLPVVVMTVVSFALGSFWHSPLMFGKTWKKENNYNVTKEQLNLPLIFGGTAVLHLIALAALNLVCSGIGAWNGLLTGLLVSGVWTLTAMGGTYLFANRSLKILAIDAGMYIVLFSLSGLIFGIW
ncbi:MAG: DUF1761 domain-containing protein [Paludibacter sp.]|nr:DUF1761 domain-containing protein [Paludibacter sp.]